MGVKINTRELLRILKLTPEQQNIMLVGRHGIGKSEIIEQFFSRRGARVVALFLGQMSDPGDLIGLPALDAAQGKTEFRPPWWFPLDNKPVVLFLDELNRARPEILQTVMDLILSKTLAGRTLPAGSRVISAVNEGEEYQLTDLDPALLSRFNIYYFSPTVEEWLLWASEQKIDGRIISFIERNPDCLDGDLMIDAGLEKGADRRSWARVSGVLAAAAEIDETVEKALAGIVGASAAFKFTEFLNDQAGTDSRIFLEDFEAAREELERMGPHELTSLNERLFRIIEVEGDPARVKRYIANLEGYVKWLVKEQRNEVLAHWTTLYESSLYPKTKVAILGNSPFIFQNIVSFIEGIKL
jgi:MoxR-like ATPase